MEILIVGKSGTGKSNLGDLLKNAIFKADKNARITTDDKDRQSKTLGKGKYTYNLHIKQLREGEKFTIPEEKYDIVVIIKGGEFISRYKTGYMQ